MRWYLFGLGSETDFHTAHWHGLRVIEEGRRRTDTVELLPASMKVVDMLADNPGSWLLHCHVAEHMAEGMFARVIVHPKNGSSTQCAPAPEFFGLAAARGPLQIPRAEATVNFKSAGRDCEIKIEGSVRIPEAFPAFDHPVKIQIGSQAATFRPNRDGVSETAGGSFRVENFSKVSSEHGIVHGGLMEFKAQLTGRDWLPKLVEVGLKEKTTGLQEISVPLTLELAGARHSVNVRMIVAAR